jgi:hypothetical protein
MQKVTFCFRGMDNFGLDPGISEITPNRTRRRHAKICAF